MTVYHDGLTEVRNPEIRRGGYVGDFGIGFYVTSSHKQAARFVRLKGGREDRRLSAALSSFVRRP